MVDVSIADPDVSPGERQRVLNVLESGQLAEGAVVDAFEAEFAGYCGTEHAVATSNGTTALQAALEALDIGPGRSVVTTPLSFVATANAVRFAGGVPVFADVKPDTFNLDPNHVEEIIRNRDGEIDAIVAVHLYGLPAEMGHLRDVADTYDIPLVEDAAQAHGARYRDEPVGSIGDVGCFSFYPTKNMTTGEGGMITTDRDDIAEATRRFIDHGRDETTGEHVELGHNFRMTNLEAAIGREQLQRLPEFVSDRRENAHTLTEKLADTPVETPTEPDDRRHAYHQYTVRCQNRDRVRDRLERNDIDTAVYYPNCIHEHEAYDRIDGETPVAQAATDSVVSLPVHPGVTDEDIDAIAETVTETVTPL